MVQALYAFCMGIRPANMQNMLYQYRQKKGEAIYSAYFNWCIVDDELGPVLVDQSFTPACTEALHIEFKPQIHPVDFLKSLGFNAEDVRHVILTHLHWDHYAGDNFYPNAVYHVHQKEIHYVTSAWMKYETYAKHYYFPALKNFMNLLFDGRVRIIEDDLCPIADGITAVRLGGHTPGLLAVNVRKDNESRLLTSDVCPLLRNLEETIPCGIHYDVNEVFQALETIRRTAKTAENVIPGHDPGVRERFPEVAPAVYRLL